MTSSNGDEPERGGADTGDSYELDTNDTVPRPKRIACILCRKRKLKCDSNKPSCGTCSRLNHHCEYSEERKKSGPKRGYVKLLEARLKQVENLLEARDVPQISQGNSVQVPQAPMPAETFAPMPPLAMPDVGDTSMSGMLNDNGFTEPALAGITDFGMNPNDFSWEMIGLGLEEALPSREAIDELYDGADTSLSNQLLMSLGTRYTSKKFIHRYP
jgi:hypothetical protein